MAAGDNNNQQHGILRATRNGKQQLGSGVKIVAATNGGMAAKARSSIARHSIAHTRRLPLARMRASCAHVWRMRCMPLLSASASDQK